MNRKINKFYNQPSKLWVCLNFFFIVQRGGSFGSSFFAKSEFKALETAKTCHWQVAKACEVSRRAFFERIQLSQVSSRFFLQKNLLSQKRIWQAGLSPLQNNKRPVILIAMHHIMIALRAGRPASLLAFQSFAFSTSSLPRCLNPSGCIESNGFGLNFFKVNY